MGTIVFVLHSRSKGPLGMKVLAAVPVISIVTLVFGMSWMQMTEVGIKPSWHHLSPSSS